MRDNPVDGNEGGGGGGSGEGGGKGMMTSRSAGKHRDGIGTEACCGWVATDGDEEESPQELDQGERRRSKFGVLIGCCHRFGMFLIAGGSGSEC